MENFDLEAVKTSAQALKDKLAEHMGDEEVAAFAEVILPYVEQALAGEITQPLDWNDMPGQRSFSEGGLREYRSLEEAFSVFLIEVTGERDDEILEYIASLQPPKG